MDAIKQSVDGLTDVITSPWSVMDEYDERLHGQPEQKAPPAARSLALAYTLLLIAAALTAGYGLWFAAGAAMALFTGLPS